MWHFDDVLKALNYVSLPTDIKLGNISIDTRTIAAGDIFLCLKGEKSDGHQYIETALQKGAGLIIASDPTFVQNATYSYILVDDGEETLRKLAIYARANATAQMIAVTGSAGKTTTKEFLNQILSQIGETVASPKSYNNHLGVPYSLSQLEQSTKFGVFEIGMNNVGEIEPLSKMVQPSIAIVTTIAPAHIGHLGSMEAIAKEKSQIFKGLTENGIALINGDLKESSLLIDAATESGCTKILTVGCGEHNDYQLITYDQGDTNTHVKIKTPKGTFDLSLSLFGQHLALTCLFVLAVTDILYINTQDVLSMLANLQPIDGRGRIMTFSIDHKNITLIDDAYNANLLSMKAGLDVLDRLPKAGRKIAVLGDMLELGDFSESIHAEICDYVNTKNIDVVYCVGHEMTKAALHIHKSKVVIYPTIDALKNDILNDLQSEDIILTKGSNGSRIHELVSFFLNTKSKAA
jgi:UDP-N-acetylmuramoyl-tripeptide--D-alanyl-D-alanine ligase